MISIVSISGGKWAIGLGIYFFTLYVIIFLLVGVAYDNPEYSINIDGIYAADPGFQKSETPYTDNAICQGTLPLSASFCRFTRAVDNLSCAVIPGCEWDDSDKECEGVPNLADYGGGCSIYMNETLCRLLGCQWVTMSTTEIQGIVSAEETDVDFSKIKKSFGIMTGFDAGLGIPASYQWIISFMFFWIPFLIFLIAIYTLIPFI